jgi:hypothetical protein
MCNKVYSIDIDNIVTNVYNRILIPCKFKKYITNKNKIIQIICEKKELFDATLKGGIPESILYEFLNYLLIISNIIVVGKGISKKKQRDLTNSCSNYYLYLIVISSTKLIYELAVILTIIIIMFFLIIIMFLQNSNIVPRIM